MLSYYFERHFTYTGKKPQELKASDLRKLQILINPYPHLGMQYMYKVIFYAVIGYMQYTYVKHCWLCCCLTFCCISTIELLFLLNFAGM